MTLTQIFRLPDGRLRSGWRILIFGGVLAGLVVALGTAAFPLLGQSHPITYQALVFCGGTAGATWVMLWRFDHLPFAAVGFQVHGPWARELLTGSLTAGGLVGAITAAEWSLGVLGLEWSGGTTLESAPISFLTLVLIVSATSEELLFRGYPFQRLVEGTNAFVAVAILSIAFGLVHAQNPHATELSVINTVLAGILISLLYLKTRGLWHPIGFHFAWNWTLLVIGHPVSGLSLVEMPWRVVPQEGYVWLHGGDYGPEGGLITSIALCLAIAYWLRRKTTSSPRPEPPQALFPEENPLTG